LEKFCPISKIFLILGTITGFVFIIITPPFQVPDEGAHFFRAYQTSTWNLKLDKRDGRVGADLPRSLMETRRLFDDIPLHPSRTVNKSLYNQALSLNARDSAFCWTILPYPPVAYIGQSVGIWIGKAVSASPLIWLYLARIFNLLLFLLMAFYAIRWMPEMKWGLALLALMPMTLYEAASTSADVYTIGISFLMTAFLLRCAASDHKLILRDIFILLAGTALLALAKPGYSPIILLAFLIPAKRFGSQKRKLLAIGGMLAIALIIGVFCIFAMRDFVWAPPGVDSASQFRFILTHPFFYVALVFRCIFRASQFGSFIGWFGWLELRLPLWIIIPYFLLLALVAFERKKNPVTMKQRWIIGGVFALLVYAVFTMQYLSYTPIGKRSVDSIQGRYFIPFAPLLLFLFYSRRISFSLEENAILRRLLIGFVVFAHAASAVLILKRYYPLG
jgi:uncharacterized membrane protein